MGESAEQLPHRTGPDGTGRDAAGRPGTDGPSGAREARFAAAFAACPLAASIARLDDGRFIAVNGMYDTLFGWPASDLVGRTSIEVGLWPEAQARRAWIDSLRRSQRLAGYAAMFRRRDGALRNVAISAEIIVIEGEAHILAFVQDLTEQVLAQARLETSEAKFRQIAETIPEVFWIVSPDWRNVLYLSPAYERIWGRPAEALYENGMAWLDAVIDSDRPALLAAIPAPHTLARCAVVSFPDYQILRPDGQTRWISARAFPVRDEAGQIIHFTGIAEDITARKHAESELLAAKKAAELASGAKSRFLAAASHDLRQPMQAVALFASALARTPLDDEQRQIVNSLERAASALGGLLDALLDISRLDAGAVRPRLEWVDLHRIFQQIDQEFSAAAIEKGLRFKLCFPQRAIELRTDPQLLGGMLRNLIGNALRYTRRGGVLVGARARGERLLIQVWDTGIGIAPDDLPLIYDEFFQVDNRQRDRTQGLGLGLSIVRRLAALQGYGIACRSRQDGGSVFELAIPAQCVRTAGGASRPADLEAAGRDRPRLDGRRIVVAEDDTLVAESLRLWFESLGAEVSVYPCAEELLADARAAGADLYVTDFLLPGRLDGVELLTELQSRAAYPVKAVVVTGDTAAGVVGSLVATCWRVLHKPVDPEKLLSVVAQLCAGDPAG